MKITAYLLVRVTGENVSIKSYPTEKAARDVYLELYKEAREYYAPMGGFTVDMKNSRWLYNVLYHGQQIETTFVDSIDIE